MKNIIFCGYREWARTLLFHAIVHSKKRGDVTISDVIYTGDTPDFISTVPKIRTHYFDGKNKYIYERVIESANASLIIFAGWSWLVPREITERFCCICFHPSDLPLFAGGSPVQNQVFSGVTESMLTVFRMDEGIDTGPIYKKAPISLLGPIEEVFDKIALAGLPIIRDLISDFANDELNFTSQVKFESPQNIHKRRTPQDSIFTLEMIGAISFSRFQMAIDVLRDPYPNLKIPLIDVNIIVKNAIKTKMRPNDLREITVSEFFPSSSNAPIYLQVSDGFAVIVDYDIECACRQKGRAA
jgi:methionyl-tRNA formyltransferase